MSFLGMKILYEILNAREDIWCERAFMPWVDMKEEMEKRGIPLYALESKDELRAFDMVGFTLQYELSYTNIPVSYTHLDVYKRQEEHSVIGGLYSAVCETVCGEVPCRVKPVARCV